MPRLLSALVLSVSVLTAAAAAHADDTGVWKALKGKILVSDQAFGASYDSDRAMIAGFKKQARTELKGNDGSWTLNLMVFLKAPAGAEVINIVYYDVTDPKNRDQVNFAEVSVTTTQKTVQINGTTVSKELGFVAGHKYEILATRIVNNKEDVYAKAIVTLR